MSRSRGKSFDSFYNRVYRPSCTLDTILPQSSFSIVSCLSRPAELHPVVHPTDKVHRFSTARPRKNPRRLPCCFSGISTPFLLPHGSTNQCQINLNSTGRVGCSDLEPSFKCSSKCAFCEIKMTSKYIL
jgi:hypothetical protein